jgi:hypothetical protein
MPGAHACERRGQHASSNSSEPTKRRIVDTLIFVFVLRRFPFFPGGQVSELEKSGLSLDGHQASSSLSATFPCDCTGN